ncbi:MAG: VCBS repeat-containing protein, partial [Phycisphaerales bacterium]|nr:VCBS repeat-containing protein [Phycisphaerales bacterium]
QSSTRLAAATALTGQDNIEKDFAMADFDQDGDTDLVVMRKFPGSIQSTCATCGFFRDLILMNENGVLTDRTNEFGRAADAAGSQGMFDESNDRDVEAFDVNNDGWVDLVTATTMSDTVNAMLGQPRIYRNLGDNASGVWQGFRFEDARIPVLTAKNGSTANPRFCDLAVADFNGDGFVDLYFVDYDTPETSGTICYDLNNDGDSTDAGECQQSPGETASLDYDNKLLFNWGNSGGGGPGYFYDTTSTKMTATQLASAFGNMCMPGDFNSDGLQDVIRISTLTGGQDAAVLSNKTGASGPGQTWTLKSVYSGLAPYGMNVADLNGDGKLDFVIADDGQDRYCLNTGNAADGQPNFALTVMTGTPSEFGNTISVGDLNRDGRADIIITDIDADLGPFCPSSGRRTKIYRNTGVAGGGLLVEDTTVLSTADLSNLFDVAVFDINGDGWLDMVTGGCAGLKVFINQPPIPLAFAFPSGVPTTIPAGATFDVPVTITTLFGTIQAGSEVLRHRINNSAWSSTPLLSGGAAGSYIARLPATACGQNLDFYVSATSTSTGNPTVTSPATAPAAFYSPDPTTGTTVIVDENFEGAATGWVATADAGLTGGGWQLGDPFGSTSSGSPAEPTDDHTPGAGVKAFITQIGLSGQTASAHDVDGGAAHLTSPSFTNGGSDVTISWWRWYYCSSTTQLDPLEVAVSVDGGVWTALDRSMANATTWQQRVFQLSSAVNPGQAFRLRVSISDLLTASTLEAGFDDLLITRQDCVVSNPCPADVSDDGAIDGVDLTMVLSGWGTGGASDVDGDGNTNGVDLASVLGGWGPCP